jgi:transcriptional regulator with XRE-family HTH domain
MAPHIGYETAWEIRRLREEEKWTWKQLLKKYQINRCTLWKILSYQTYYPNDCEKYLVSNSLSNSNSKFNNPQTS